VNVKQQGNSQHLYVNRTETASSVAVQYITFRVNSTPSSAKLQKSWRVLKTKMTKEKGGGGRKKGIISSPLICIQPVALRQRGMYTFSLKHEQITAI
jgi:hypothetical protein